MTTPRTLFMIWPLANNFDRDRALQAAHDEIAEISRHHQLRIADGRYELLEPGCVYGSTRWHVTFHGAVWTGSVAVPLPLQIHRMSLDEPRGFIDHLIELPAGFALTMTREHGIKLIPEPATDRFFDVAPLADLDDHPVATVHHLPVGATA